MSDAKWFDQMTWVEMIKKLKESESCPDFNIGALEVFSMLDIKMKGFLTMEEITDFGHNYEVNHLRKIWIVRVGRTLIEDWSILTQFAFVTGGLIFGIDCLNSASKKPQGESFGMTFWLIFANVCFISAGIANFVNLLYQTHKKRLRLRRAFSMVKHFLWVHCNDVVEITTESNWLPWNWFSDNSKIQMQDITINAQTEEYKSAEIEIFDVANNLVEKENEAKSIYLRDENDHNNTNEMSQMAGQ